MKKRIVYEDIPVESGVFVVDELSYQDLSNDTVIAQLLGTITAAYTAQYASAGFMSEEAIRERYNPDDPSNVQWFKQRTLVHFLGAGSQIFAAKNTSEPGRIMGFAKMSNGPAADKKAPPGSIYLNDIVVSPPWRAGVGSATAHAAFKFGGHVEDSLVLEGFVGSSVNTWYTDRWGLTAGKLSQQFRVSGAWEQYFYTPEGHTLGDIALRLETHNPALTSARLE